MKSMLKTKDLSAIGASLMLHVVILASMAVYRFDVFQKMTEFTIDSVATDERDYQEFNKSLDINTEVASSDNRIAGGIVATTVGTRDKIKMPQQKIKKFSHQKKLRPFNRAGVIIPSGNTMSDSMGELALSGETGTAVAGYGAALSQITQELLRLLEKDKLLVVWLFDESESMKDDQQEIAKNFEKVYRELGISSSKKSSKNRSGKKTGPKKNRGVDDPLLSAVIGYGETVHSLTKRPTADINTIRAAINKIAVDKSGKENMCFAILKSIKKYNRQLVSQKRKLVFIVVTDESGDDGELIESTIEKARRIRAPVYVLGREAVFGYTHARIRWRDPKYHMTFWLKLNRGPETAFVECMQWDGLRDRYDVFSSGFGPYEQVRLAKETGGVFFLLPGNEKNLISKKANDRRKFDFLDMKEYQPLLLSRRNYVSARDRSKKFRSKIWDVIVTLNPNDDNPLPRYDENLRIKELFYKGDIGEFKKEASRQVQKAVRAMQLLNKAIAILDKAKPFRDREASQRWRASYDLLRAQCFAYRVRLFQFLLAMDDHASKSPPFKKQRSNVWNVRRTPRLLKPDKQQYKRLASAFSLRASQQKFLTRMDEQMKESTKRFRFVISQHPGTPWARRASSEMRQGFGMMFVEGFRDPRIGKVKIKIPKF
ncbi:hypothetical protein MNBD_PLANCTO02-2933 [hydrothermal vent metagenome]|uniref:VWFA domain-containing protein n=1 Tax=hydrothermal vent metagenome TaxID=652676 RepID=A0A3B1E2I4_9ZZZZ